MTWEQIGLEIYRAVRLFSVFYLIFGAIDDFKIDNRTLASVRASLAAWVAYTLLREIILLGLR